MSDLRQLIKEVGARRALCLVISWWCYRKWRQRKPNEVGYRGVTKLSKGFVHAPYIPEQSRSEPSSNSP